MPQNLSCHAPLLMSEDIIPEVKGCRLGLDREAKRDTVGVQTMDAPGRYRCIPQEVSRNL